MTKANWFEEVFLPSCEEKMNNPKYPNQMILSEKQMMICEKYMKAVNCCDVSYGKEFITWKYQTGTKSYTMTHRGKYYFLHVTDFAKQVFYVRNTKTNADIITFKTEQEMIEWLDQHVDDDTGTLTYNGMTLEICKWHTGCHC